MSKFLKMFAALGLIIGLAVPANAGLVLVIDDGDDGADVTCVDNDMTCDMDSDIGQISYSDDVGDWSIDLAFLESEVQDNIAELQSNLNIDYSGNGEGTLAILVYDDAFDAPIGVGTAVTEIDGSEVEGGLEACSYIDGVEIACDSDLMENEELTGSIQAETEDPFTLSQEFVITAENGDETQIDATTTFSVPEPAVLGLLGFGLVGVGVARRRKKVA